MKISSPSGSFPYLDGEQTMEGTNKPNDVLLLHVEPSLRCVTFALPLRVFRFDYHIAPDTRKRNYRGMRAKYSYMYCTYIQ